MNHEDKHHQMIRADDKSTQIWTPTTPEYTWFYVMCLILPTKLFTQAYTIVMFPAILKTDNRINNLTVPHTSEASYIYFLS